MPHPCHIFISPLFLIHLSVDVYFSVNETSWVLGPHILRGRADSNLGLSNWRVQLSIITPLSPPETWGHLPLARAVTSYLSEETSGISHRRKSCSRQVPLFMQFPCTIFHLFIYLFLRERERERARARLSGGWAKRQGQRI